MDVKTLVLQLLDEAHATETALVTNLRAHITMSEGRHKRLLERHLRETQEQVENIDRRRAAIGGDEGRGIIAAGVGLARDAAGQAIVMAKGPLDVVRARGSAERMLKNAKDECATEALEIATYDALEAAAKAAGDTETAKLAADHRKTEERMLADLRKLIPTLAVATFEDRTGATAKPAATATRSRSSTSAKRSAAAKKAAQTRKAKAAKSTSTRSRAKSS